MGEQSGAKVVVRPEPYEFGRKKLGVRLVPAIHPDPRKGIDITGLGMTDPHSPEHFSRGWRKTNQYVHARRSSWSGRRTSR